MAVIGLCLACTHTRLDKNYVLTTTGILYDVTENLLEGNASNIKVGFLMGEGTDPHLYKVSQIDIQKMIQSTFIIANGLHLEGKMETILQKIGSRKKVLLVGNIIDKKYLIKIDDFINDPHIWFDPIIWKQITRSISVQLQILYPAENVVLVDNLRQYTKKLEELDSFVRERINEIPIESRVLITSHDAFKYFGKRYGMQVKALQGISTTAEYGLRDIEELVDFIVTHNIKAIFAETSLPSKGLEAVAKGVENRGRKLKIISGLYSDALGKFGTSEGTYIGMYKSNINKIVENLK